MAKLPRYNVTIEWDGDCFDDHPRGTITLPDDSTVIVHRHIRRSMYKVSNGPFFTGETYFTLETPTGEARFESFEDLMQRGLGLTPII